jgi:hypothetical protein
LQPPWCIVFPGLSSFPDFERDPHGSVRDFLPKYVTVFMKPSAKFSPPKELPAASFQLTADIRVLIAGCSE